jgi:hypothetical protein
MAHVRKDTLTASPEWWKHLRRENKRRFAKQERRATRKLILTIIHEFI